MFVVVLLGESKLHRFFQIRMVWALIPDRFSGSLILKTASVVFMIFKIWFFQFIKNLSIIKLKLMKSVRTRRLELPREKLPLAPQASASTNSATCAIDDVEKKS